MAWTKSPELLATTFESVLPMDPRAVRRRMFGKPCAFAAGNMFAGLHEDTMVLRLADDDRERFLGLPGARLFEPTPGRVMREYVAVPPTLLGDTEALRAWVQRAFSYGASLQSPRPRSLLRRRR